MKVSLCQSGQSVCIRVVVKNVALVVRVGPCTHQLITVNCTNSCGPNGEVFCLVYTLFRVFTRHRGQLIGRLGAVDIIKCFGLE